MAAKQAKRSNSSKNTVEARDTIGFLDDVKNEVKAIPSDFMKTAWDQFFQTIGAETPGGSHKGEMKAGEAVVFNGKNKQQAEHAPQPKPEKQHRPDIAPAYNYFQETFRTVNNSERLTRRESAEMQYKIKEIMVELKRLVDTSTILQDEFKEVTMSEAPKTPGQYHLNFFDWVLTIIRAARMKVEDSGAWLASMKGKKGKQGYWGMFKKHGTSFGMSNERSVATQSG